MIVKTVFFFLLALNAFNVQLYHKDLRIDREGHNQELILKVLQFQHCLEMNTITLLLISLHFSLLFLDDHCQRESLLRYPVYCQMWTLLEH